MSKVLKCSIKYVHLFLHLHLRYEQEQNQEGQVYSVTYSKEKICTVAVFIG